MKTRKKLAKKELASGEVTGHAHRVAVDVYEREDGLRELVGPTPITHEEHGEIALPAGDLVSGVGREYDHFLEEAREVRD